MLNPNYRCAVKRGATHKDFLRIYQVTLSNDTAAITFINGLLYYAEKMRFQIYFAASLKGIMHDPVMDPRILSIKSLVAARYIFVLMGRQK